MPRSRAPRPAVRNQPAVFHRWRSYREPSTEQGACHLYLQVATICRELTRTVSMCTLHLEATGEGDVATGRGAGQAGIKHQDCLTTVLEQPSEGDPDDHQRHHR